ncbi:MAG: endonuclease/exonuclease/phosphatase family protein [Pirellulaceae bacterium]|nr:endonuclease/exonuclease/phosphatase family protein [Pirellulaceae bacterium]
MRHLWVIVATIFVVPAALQALSAGCQSAEPELRVLSYNIHHAEGVDGKLDLQRIAQVIQSVRPDIVALQEVDSTVKRSGNVDQAAELGRLTGMQHLFGGNIELQGGQYGNAILAKGTITKSTNHRLPNIDNGEQRGILDATITLPGRTLRVLATHFDHRRDPRERMQSIEMANSLVTKTPAEPTLLVGDLNAEFESDVLKRATSVWQLTNRERMPTIPVKQPERQIDFVLTYPAGAWRVKEVKVLDESIASDHRPIFVVLE